MKKMLITFFLFAAWCGMAHAQKEGVGIGVIVGEPTGISFKTWSNKRDALAAAAAWSFSNNDTFQGHIDYEIHKYFLKPRGMRSQIPFYFGIGGRVRLREVNRRNSNSDVIVSMRLPLGISILFSGAPLDIFAEMVPTLDLVPNTYFDLYAALGLRFYF